MQNENFNKQNIVLRTWIPTDQNAKYSIKPRWEKMRDRRVRGKEDEYLKKDV